MTEKEIQQALELIRKHIELDAPVESPALVMEKMSNLINLMGMAAECHVQAERIYNLKVMELYEEPKYADMGATDKKALFAGKCANEIALMNRAHEYSKKVDKAVEGLRTIISYAKNEQRAFGS